MPPTPPETARRSLHALPPGTVLHDYVIDSELGSGGFSVVYLARHRLNSDWLFAIKEYLPRELAVRDAVGASVHPVNTEVEDAFADGLRRFRDEAEQLRRFRNERYVVSCLNYFEANGTAYLVMDYDDGLPLSEFLRRREAAGQPFTESDLRAVIEPLLEGLEAVHRAGVLHRDIKPGNIFVRRPDDITGRPAQPVLIDFGAAKQNYLSMHSRSQAPYTPGYAAYEQVSSEGDIGPWTDIYAVGALMWRIVAGGCQDDERLLVPEAANENGGASVRSPTPRQAERRAYALHRGRGDPMSSAVELGAGRFPRASLAAIDRCLALYPEDRVQSCGELRSLFDNAGVSTTAATSAGATTPSGIATPAGTATPAGPVMPAGTGDTPKREAMSGATTGPGRVAAAVAAVLLVLYGFLVLRAPDSPGSLPDVSENGSTGAPPSSVVNEPAPPSVAGGSASSEPTRETVALPVSSLGASFADELSSGGEGPEMVAIPAGRFQMGCVLGNDCHEGELPVYDEMPVHNVTIPRAFAVSKHEVTFAEWDACVAGGGCGGFRPSDEGWGRGRRPVINVSWDDARQFVAWLSEHAGTEYRLLSEAEWEYVARAGSQSAYSWGNDIGVNRANCINADIVGLGACGNQWENTAPVGSFEPNAFGVHDMHGNVYEWVEDCWNESYVGAPSDGSSWWSGDCTRRVLRGGSWSSIPWSLRSADRGWDTVDIRDLSYGFRVARTLVH